jgi:hypothetical protein
MNHLLSDLARVTLYVAGTAVTIDAAVRVSGTVFGKTLGSRWRTRRSIERLAANETGRFFESVLGVPTVERSHPRDLRERVWAGTYTFVQAFTDGDDRVLIYSVTTRSNRFKLRVPFPNGGKYWGTEGATVEATLGKTPLAIPGVAPIRISGSMGARRFWYSEVYGFGNPANYQEVVLTLNEAASLAGDPYGVIRAVDPLSDWHRPLDPDDDELTEARRHAFPNTFSVAAPHFALSDVDATEGLFGVDGDTVRVLPA